MFAVLHDAETADALATRARAELDPMLWTCAGQIVLSSSSS